MSLVESNELLVEFTEEAIEHVTIVENELLVLENSSGDADTIHNIFRALHSIKGTAAFFSLENIVNLSHVMETIFDGIRNGHLIISDKIIDHMLSANDSLKKMVQNVSNSGGMDISKHLSVLNDLNANQEIILEDSEPDNISHSESLPTMVEVSSKSFSEQKTELEDAVAHDRSIFKVYSPSSYEETAEQIKAIGHVVHQYWESNTLPGSTSAFHKIHVFIITTVLEKSLVAMALDIREESIEELSIEKAEKECSKEPTSPPLLDYKVLAEEYGTTPKINEDNNHAVEEPKQTPKKTMQKAGGQAPLVSEAVRVNVRLLNDLLNLASEMVLGRNRLLRVIETHRKDIPGLNGVLQNIDRITTELQEKVMQTRMQPLAKVFHKFPRLTRELSKQMGKDIELEIEGNDVELDKSIVEALGDPLTHLVRNSIDHGIETPDQREKSEKPRTGKVFLKAYHEGGHVVIDVMDDGSGIELEKIKNKATENGIVSINELSQMGERELLELLFRPGFSTADQITDLSGRGVGLDVVKNNIEKLGGVMEIINAPGQGTTFRLTLPITLAIVPSLLVEVLGLKFALPQVNLQEMVRVKPEETVNKLQVFHDSMLLRLRGKLVPTIRLSDVLGIQRNDSDTEDQLLRILIVKSGSKRFGLIVDHIHDDEEILVKHLPRHLKECQCYSGMTVLGDGQIAMILDLEGISAKAGFKFSEDQQEINSRTEILDPDHLNEKQNLLLFKCSGPETFCINLDMVARVEKILVDHIESIGDKEYIQFRGSALRVIRPENYLPVSKNEHTDARVFVVVPKLIKHPIGILINQIVDTVETNINFRSNDFTAKGILGSAILGERITLVINMYELFELADPDHYNVKHKYKADVKTTVLLAEDTPFFAKMERNYLESAGYEVVTATNGQEAWELLQRNKIDLVVSDIVMPLMNGYELVKRIRGDSKFAHLPVIAVTTRNDQQSIRKGLDAGFDYYEIKLNKESFLSKIGHVLERKANKV